MSLSPCKQNKTCLHTDELDSYMYQTVGHHAIELYADAMSLPLFRRIISGSPIEQGSNYSETCRDEVEDLYELLKEVKVSVCRKVKVSTAPEG